jgi:hypothetical protein
VEQLFDLAALVNRMFASSGLEYRLIGGLAVYLYIEEREPDAGRLTKDVDIAVRRADLEKIAEAAGRFGFQYRHVAGVDMLVQAGQPSGRRAIHLVFAGEKVRPEYPAATPELGLYREVRGLRLIPLEELIRMKLTSFRASDEAHLKDLDQAGLITSAMVEDLPPILAERLARMRERA